MHLRSVDLNLLVVLEAPLDEAHVSRAAEHLRMSQPATSSALERCRHLFKDPLLERARGAMRLSPKAEGLRQPLKRLLAEVAAILDPKELALSDLRQTVRVQMADYPATVVLGPLQKKLASSAPGIDLVLHSWPGEDAALEALTRSNVDLTTSVYPATDSSLRCQELLLERFVVVMSK